MLTSIQTYYATCRGALEGGLQPTDVLRPRVRVQHGIEEHLIGLHRLLPQLPKSTAKAALKQLYTSK